MLLYAILNIVCVITLNSANRLSQSLNHAYSTRIVLPDLLPNVQCRTLHILNVDGSLARQLGLGVQR